jgi:hypothetical protein
MIGHLRAFNKNPLKNNDVESNYSNTTVNTEHVEYNNNENTEMRHTVPTLGLDKLPESSENH